MNKIHLPLIKIFKVDAMVIYPFVLFSNKNPSQTLINHEQIHLNQIKKDGVLKFYFNYFKEYFIGRMKGMSHQEAYRNISYEVEAYNNE